MKKAMIVGCVLMLSAVMATLAVAQSYDIKTMTPAIQQALEGRRARFGELSALKQQGALGENNRGYLEVLAGNPQAQSVANAENADRRVVYTAIAEQNGLSGAMGTIESVYGGVQRDRAQAGEKIQLDDGQWIVK